MVSVAVHNAGYAQAEQRSAGEGGLSVRPSYQIGAKSYVDQCLIVADIRDRAIVNSRASLPTIRDALGIPIGWHVRQVTIPV